MKNRSPKFTCPQCFLFFSILDEKNEVFEPSNKYSFDTLKDLCDDGTNSNKSTNIQNFVRFLYTRIYTMCILHLRLILLRIKTILEIELDNLNNGHIPWDWVIFLLGMYPQCMVMVHSFDF